MLPPITNNSLSNNSNKEIKPLEVYLIISSLSSFSLSSRFID